MMYRCLSFILLWGLLSFSACSEDDYHYPSVRQEFLTVVAGEDGFLNKVQTDEGEWFSVIEDRSRTQIDGGHSARIVSNCERVVLSDGSEEVRVYAVLKAIASLPKPVEDFVDGVKTEPASVTSIWMGYDYLNVILSVLQQGKHRLHFVEKEVGEPDMEGTMKVDILLYHGVESSLSDYSKRVYLSVPLRQYAKEGVRKVVVNFSLWTNQAADDPYVKPETENLKLKTYQFVYVPR